MERRSGPRGTELHRAADPAKDQSYFLFATTPAQLDFLRFPIGHMSKRETRGHAHRLGLDVADKPDSQDICFVPGGRYADVVRRLRPGAVDPGEIVHVDGTILGRHDGVINFTVGQRKGLGIGGRRDPGGPEDSAPLFVVGVEPETRRVVVGPREALARAVVEVGAVNWLGDAAIPDAGTRVMVKLRSTQHPVSAELRLAGGGSARLILEAPEYGIARGQAAVFYAPDGGTRVLGGGWITGTAAALDSDRSPASRGTTAIAL